LANSADANPIGNATLALAILQGNERKDQVSAKHSLHFNSKKQ
jgi:hypothetical protein